MRKQNLAKNLYKVVKKYYGGHRGVKTAKKA
jgi:hypothetical protein